MVIVVVINFFILLFKGRHIRITMPCSIWGIAKCESNFFNVENVTHLIGCLAVINADMNQKPVCWTVNIFI